MQDLERAPSAFSSPPEEAIDLWAMVRVVLKRRRLVAGVTGLGWLSALLIALSQPNIYTASATLMPVDASSDRLSAAMSALGALGGLASQAGANLKGNVGDKFVALLNSRTITENVVTNHSLLPVLFADQWDASHSKWKQPRWVLFGNTKRNDGPSLHDTYRLMSRRMKASADPKTGIVRIKVEHSNPQVAADIANYYLEELEAMLQRNTFSSATRNRAFLEKQVAGVLNDLGKQESELKRFQSEHKLVSLSAQTEAAVEAYASLKSQLTAKEMALALEEKSLSAEDVSLTGLRSEIAAIKDKLASIDSGKSEGWVSFKDAPELGMRFAQLKRDLLVKEKVFELLTQQLEIAKVDEAKETLSFQVVDHAVAPDRKSKPARLLNVLAATIASFFLGIMLAFGVDAYPSLASKLRELKNV